MVAQIQWRGTKSFLGSPSSSFYDNNDDERASNGSFRSYGTAPTMRSFSRPPCEQFGLCIDQGGFYDYVCEQPGGPASDDERIGSEYTYASTEMSGLDFDFEADDESSVNVQDFEADAGYESDTIPASPADFADLFPSSRVLLIHHDDSTLDGNMNLRVDTQVDLEWSRRKQSLSLFHFRMNDLASRDFSLRRYCRNSGREVCKFARKYHDPCTRPAMAKPFHSVLTPFKKHQSAAVQHPQRSMLDDPGYRSASTADSDDRLSEESADHQEYTPRLPTNTIQLEFSNYAHVDLKCRGSGSSQRYKFEYWGHKYTWKRYMRKEADAEAVSYHLYRSDRLEAVAHIVPVPLTREQAGVERAKGGWVAPSSLWISDDEVVRQSPDVADLIVATGLVALADGSIRRRLRRRLRDQNSEHLGYFFLSMVGNALVGVEFVGPKGLIDMVFHRRRPGLEAPSRR